MLITPDIQVGTWCNLHRSHCSGASLSGGVSRKRTRPVKLSSHQVTLLCPTLPLLPTPFPPPSAELDKASAQ